MKADCQNMTTANTKEITRDNVEDVNMSPILSELTTA